MTKKKDKKEKTKEKKEETEGKPRRVLRWVILIVLAVVAIAALSVAHTVRGTLIVRPNASDYAQAVRRTAFGSLSVQSLADMNDLGAIAYRTVEQEGLKPGTFYVHFLPKLDSREKLHHALHSPFTGLRSIYTDIWINSCTAYGVKESTWAPWKASVYPADKLSILIILVDRLKREKTGMGEHLGAYVEVLRGMKLHTVRGRASCYLLLVNQCARDRELMRFLQRQLRRRSSKPIDDSELDFWRCASKEPTYEFLQNLASGAAAPEPAPDPPEKPSCSSIFTSMLEGRVKSLGAAEMRKTEGRKEPEKKDEGTDERSD